MIRVLATAFFLSVSLFTHAQRCGNGVFSVIFYTPNGKKISPINYTMKPITLQELKSVLKQSRLPESSCEKALEQVHGGLVIDPALVPMDSLFALKETSAWFDMPQDSGLYEKIKSTARRLKLPKMASSGQLTREKLEFPTFETFHRLFLLRITCRSKTVYIVANFFGGCDHQLLLYWNRYKGFQKFTEENY